jgi:penicillin-binding protein 1C
MVRFRLLRQWFDTCRSVGQRRVLTISLILLGLGAIGRSLPYLAPIRAIDLKQNDQAVELTDRNGLPLGTILTRDQNHTTVVPLAQVSPAFIQAILAVEDGRFYEHGALDLRAIARAMVQAIQARRIVSGASTITMQLARMLEPTPSSLWGKAQEVWYSWRLAAGMSQREILQAYINRLPMGGNIYGVEAAARVYFGVPARDLNVAQASLLAALPNDPTYLNPYYRWHALKQRQSYVLRRMVQDGYLNQTQADRASQEKPVLLPRQQGILAAPHFLFWVANHLPLNHEPLLRTTLDRPLQQFVEAQVRQVVRALAPHNVQQAAALVIDNHSGAVLAYVGSADYFAEPGRGRNDGVQALRQPGSTLKPFVYQLALEQRLIRPNTVLADVPTYYAIPGAQLYSPVDYSETFQGPARVRIALANSLNVPAVRVLEQLTVPVFLERLRQLGFQHLQKSPDYYGLGLALGSAEVSLWELARAYVTLARQGQQIDLAVLQRASLTQTPPTPPTIGTPATWALVVDMLGDRHARAKAFGVDSVLSLPFPAAVKTGTSSNFRDTWTVGFTRDYTVATWVGNFSGESMQKVSGVMGAAPLWNRILLHLHERQEPAAFAAPEGWVKRPICALSGFKPTPTCPAIVEEYFHSADLVDYEQQPDPFYPTVPASSPSRSDVRAQFPSEYAGGLTRQPSTALANYTLQVVSPRDGDAFLLAPASAEAQHSWPQPRLEFKAAPVDAQPVEWWLNGKLLAKQRQESYFWPLQPGQWTLEVRSGQQRQRVAFEVLEAEVRTTHRGFSFKPP